MRRAGSILFAVLVCALGAGVPSAVADNASPAAATVADGVSIGPVPVGGLTADQATLAVIQAYTAPLTLTVGSKSIRVPATRFHVIAPVAAAVQQALTAPAGTTIRMRAAVDTGKLSAWVASFATQVDKAPIEPRLFVKGATPVITKPTPGLAVKTFPTTILVRNELWNGTRDPVAVPTRVIQPKVTKPAEIGPVIVIRRGLNRLSLYQGTKLVRTFPVATGQAIYPTPLGDWHIVVMWKNPTWYPPTQDAWAKGLKPVPPGPNNPLGTRWMGLDAPGVGIHGTDEPASIGYSASHGCVRMQVPDAEWLFDHVQVGTPVFIVAS
ncbi:MAG: L,D-transpeptidase family protein [Actinobacteria bacterium]|nr:L,D-transpeptidase family protein [Actinomycetota bacterium]